jgi:hypothetical protein
MKKLLLILFIILPLTMAHADDSFRCSKYTHDSLKVLKLPTCSDEYAWNYGLDELRKKDQNAFDTKIMNFVLRYNNMGGTIVKFPSGNKTVYRASFLSGNETCISNLVNKGNVKTIVNLYGGKLATQNELAIKEKTLFQQHGGQLYINILNYNHEIGENNDKQAIFKKVKSIIKQIEKSEGNVLIHCYGGVHRTGIIYGVMQKCLNKLPIDKVIEEYKCHTGYESPKLPGGYKAENITIIEEFPCETLEQE